MVAEVGAASHDFFFTGWWTAGILGNRCGIEIGGPPVGAPFPDVTDHVVEAEVVGGEGGGRCGGKVAVFAGVVVGEVSLPDVAAVLAVGVEFITPWIESRWESSPCSVFPLGFSWELFACPGCVGMCVVPGDVSDRVVGDFFDVAAGAFGV